MRENTSKKSYLIAKNEFDSLLRQELCWLRDIQLSDSKNRQRKEANRHLVSKLNTFNLGSSSYGGSVPFSSIQVEPSQRSMASDVFKTHPFALPAELPMFFALSQSCFMLQQYEEGHTSNSKRTST